MCNKKIQLNKCKSLISCLSISIGPCYYAFYLKSLRKLLQNDSVICVLYTRSIQLVIGII